jgi:phage terminase large subunit-like protein
MQRPIDLFDAYVDGVMSGDIVVSKHVRHAVERHVKDVERSKKGSLPFSFNRSIADSAIGMFPILFRHTVGKYAGTPFNLSPWQAFIVGSIFGWKDDAGRRRFRRAFVSLARKQGKSTLAAGIALLMATMDGEQQSQVYLAATKKDQAKVVFDEATRMTNSSPYISRIAKALRSSIEFPKSNSYIKILGSDRPFDGLNPHCVVLDEIHAFTEQHRPFRDTLTTGSGSRSQPLILSITTAGSNKSYIWQEENELGIKTVSGQIENENFFAFIACLDDKEELYNEEAWLKAMPNLHVSCDIEYVREQVKTQKELAFARYFGNIEVASHEQAIDPEDWDACQVDELSDWSYADAKATAIDAGGGNDLFASVDVARFEDGQTDDGKQDFRYEVKCRCYMDEATSRDLSEQPWQSWIYTDQLTVVSSLFSSVKQDTTERMYQEGIRQIGFDPWNMQQMGEQFIEDGFEAVKIPQNRFNLHEPLTLLLDLVKRGKISHDGHPILKFAITNLVINSDSQNRWMPDRKNSKEKIDPAVALIMALRLASLAKSQPKGSLFIA